MNISTPYKIMQEEFKIDISNSFYSMKTLFYAIKQQRNRPHKANMFDILHSGKSYWFEIGIVCILGPQRNIPYRHFSGDQTQDIDIEKVCSHTTT